MYVWHVTLYAAVRLPADTCAHTVTDDMPTVTTTTRLVRRRSGEPELRGPVTACSAAQRALPRPASRHGLEQPGSS